MIPEYLKPLIPQSIVKEHSRGTRRYFPILAKRRKGWNYIYQTFYIIYGRMPKDNFEAGCAILTQSIDKYVERFDNKLWVRTIAVD
jgi:hypothetical protein